MDYGETPEACALREAKEETGVDVVNVRFIGITNDMFQADQLHYITIWMVGDYHSGLPTVNEEELSELGWYTWNALPSPLFLPLQNLLDGKSFPHSTYSSKVILADEL